MWGAKLHGGTSEAAGELMNSVSLKGRMTFFRQAVEWCCTVCRCAVMSVYVFVRWLRAQLFRQSQAIIMSRLDPATAAPFGEPSHKQSPQLCNLIPLQAVNLVGSNTSAKTATPRRSGTVIRAQMLNIPTIKLSLILLSARVNLLVGLSSQTWRLKISTYSS